MISAWAEGLLREVARRQDQDPMMSLEDLAVACLVREHERANELEAALEKLTAKVSGIQETNNLWDGS